MSIEVVCINAKTWEVLDRAEADPENEIRSAYLAARTLWDDNVTGLQGQKLALAFYFDGRLAFVHDRPPTTTREA